MARHSPVPVALGALLLVAAPVVAADWTSNAPLSTALIAAPLESVELDFCLESPHASAEAGPTAPAPDEWALASSLAPGNVRRFRVNQRPPEFWWPSPEKVLASVFGPCGTRACCRFCVVGKACGDTCISRAKTCRVGCGCACDRPDAFPD